ncbi:MAG TPA: HNH endonuclease [Paenisporosarcina sp.]|nr:HNH endonuclease [Paenisporosarcina sp.]
MIKNCLNCAAEIIVKPSGYERKKYCSRKCKCEYQSGNPRSFEHLSKKRVVACSYCKKIMTRKECLIEKHKHQFCNRDCNTKFKREVEKPGPPQRRITLICEECSQKFEVIMSRMNAKYCSKKCLGKANGKRAKVILSKKITVLCSFCDKPFIKKPSGIRPLNFCTTTCMGSYYSENKLFSGELSGTWNGGKELYYGSNWQSQRRNARKRDSYICQKCGIDEVRYGQQLSVHHIKPFAKCSDFKEANALSNLICVCEPCHRKIHSGENHPSKFSKSFG